MQEKCSPRGLILSLPSTCCLLGHWSRQTLRATMEVPTSKGMKEAHGFIKLSYNFEIFTLEVLSIFEPPPQLYSITDIWKCKGMLRYCVLSKQSQLFKAASATKPQKKGVRRKCRNCPDAEPAACAC